MSSLEMIIPTDSDHTKSWSERYYIATQCKLFSNILLNNHLKKIKINKLDFINALEGDSIYSFIWLIFTFFVGIALEIDFGVFDRTKKSINRTVSKSNNNGSRALRWLWAKSNPANICGYLLIDLDGEIVRP
jgi:hypothetical protein